MPIIAKGRKVDINSVDYFKINGDRIFITYRNGRKYPYSRKNIVLSNVRQVKLKANEEILYNQQFINVRNRNYMLVDECYYFINSKKYLKKEIEFVKFKKEKINNFLSLSIFNTSDKKIKQISTSEYYFKIKYKGDEQKYFIKRPLFEEIKKVDTKRLFLYYNEIAKLKDRGNKGNLANYLENQMKKINIKEKTALYDFFNQENKKYKNEQIIIYPYKTNISQMNATKEALENKVSMIQGPPGTGKTQTILNIIANLIIRDKSIAMVSNTNKAIENVIEKLEQEGFGFLSALLGNSDNKKEFFINQTQLPKELNKWKLKETELKKLKKRIIKLEKLNIKVLDVENKLAIIKQQLIEFKHEQKYFLNYSKSENKLKLKNIGYFSPKKILSLILILNYQDLTNISIYKKIELFVKYGIFDYKQFSHTENIIVWLQECFYERMIKKLEKKNKNLVQYLKNKKSSKILEELSEKSQQLFKGVLAKKYNSKTRQKYDKTIFLNDSKFKSFINDYPITLSTTYAVSNSKSANYTFDYIIVDEASQVDLTTGVIALDTAKNAVIVGDLKQLPHIPNNSLSDIGYESLRMRYNVDDNYDYYKQNLLSAYNLIFKNNAPNTLLKEHYRCHEKIISFCNKKYYNNALICHTDFQVEKPLVLLKTTPGNHMRFGKKAEYKNINQRELESIIGKDFSQKVNLSEDKSVGFISPFVGQVALSKKILDKDYVKDTVHKYQGREKDVIFFSTVLDSKKHGRGFDHVNRPELINVAVSRAKEKFILVSDVDTFKNRKCDIGDLIRYIEYHEENSILIESNVRSIFDLLYPHNKQILEAKKKDPNWSKSKYDSENLVYELVEKICKDEKYSMYKFKYEVRLKEIFKIVESYLSDEVDYIKRNSRVDILFYNKFDNQPVLGVEVDGYEYHDNNPEQLIRDKLKNNIFAKNKLPLIRLSTIGSNEEERIKEILDKIDT